MDIVGQQFKQRPAEFEQIQKLLSAQAMRFNREPAHWGFIAQRKDYESLLGRCDVVLSTALHDFQGLSIQEATLAGCAPLAPADLVYPEYLPTENLYAREATEQQSAAHILAKLEKWQERKAKGEALPTVNLEDFKSAALAPSYRELFRQTLEAHSQT